MLGFREICSVTAALPMVTLFICFVSAVVFQFDDVHETHCRVRIASIIHLANFSDPNFWFLFSFFFTQRFAKLIRVCFCFCYYVSTLHPGWHATAGIQFYTIDKRHYGHQSKYLFLANFDRIACGTAFYNCHLLQKLLWTYAVPCQESNSSQQRFVVHETGVLVTHRRNNFALWCYVHFQPRKL